MDTGSSSGISASKACPVCDAPAAKRCSRCASVHYCSSEHQAEHWPTHKSECRKQRKHPAGSGQPEAVLTPAQKNAKIPKTVGSTFTVDAILFPADEDTPRVVQMGFVVKDAEDGGTGITPTWHLWDKAYMYFERFLGDKCVGRSIIYHSKPGGALLPGGCTLDLMYRDNYANDGSTTNRCIQRLTGGDTVHDFRGNFLALRRPGGVGGEDLIGNIEDGDLEILRNYFIGYRRARTAHPDALSAQDLANMGFKILQL